MDERKVDEMRDTFRQWTKTKVWFDDALKNDAEWIWNDAWQAALNASLVHLLELSTLYPELEGIDASLQTVKKLKGLK